MRKSTSPLNQEIFMSRIVAVHGNRYLYGKTKYVNRRTKVTITCRTHGDFEQLPSGHVLGNHCPKCASLKASRTLARKTGTCMGGKGRHSNRSSFLIFSKRADSQWNTNQYIEKATKTHNGYYKYSLEGPVKNIETSEFTITCPIHGVFKQQIKRHTLGAKCPQCARLQNGYSRSFYKDRKTSFYVVKIPNNLYKIGITRTTIRQRYRLEAKENIEEVYFKSFEDGAVAWDLEKHVLRQFGKFKYKGEKVLKHTGITEILTINPTEYILTYVERLF